MSLGSDIKSLVWVSQVNGERFEYQEEDGSTDYLTIDLTFVMWFLVLSMIVTCLWIYQVKSTIELVKPIFLEIK
jgi:hypothetical protein